MVEIPAELDAALLGWVREKFVDAGEAMTVETDLFQAGLDSMGIMQLLILIEERCGVRVPEAAVTRASSPGSTASGVTPGAGRREAKSLGAITGRVGT